MCPFFQLSLSDTHTHTRTQEFVMPGKSGAKLKRPFEGKNVMLNGLTPGGVAQLAEWERCIRNRYIYILGVYTWCTHTENTVFVTGRCDVWCI